MTPCHSSGHLVIYHECYGFEIAFFTLHSFLLVSRLPWGRQFNIKVIRASCCSSKHSPGPAICLNHSNPQMRYGGWFYLRVVAGRLRNEESASHGILSLFAIGEHARSLMIYPFHHKAIQSMINESSNLCHDLCFKSS